MTIKHGLGKLPLDRPIRDFIVAETSVNEIGIANINPEHVFELLQQPANPRDPFDRRIAAQCRVEGFRLVSGDNAMDGFGVNRIWD